jgi:hypothetical protein
VVTVSVMKDTDQKPKRPKPHVPPKESIELREDGWERFEKAVDAALHTKPMHRKAKPRK